MNILAIGPTKGVVTGQSNAFSTFVAKSKHKILVVNTNAEGMRSFRRSFVSIAAIWKTFRIFLSSSCIDCLYITTSRSKAGSIKDIACIGLASIFGVPVVNHLHGANFTKFRDELGFFQRGIIDWVYSKVHVSIVLHDKLRTQYSCFKQMRIEVVENFVSSEIAVLNRSGRDVVAGEIRVLYLSNILPEKGIYELMSAFSNISKIQPMSFSLKIAGKILPDSSYWINEFEKRLQSGSAAGGLIEYCGVADMEQKLKLLHWADILCLPSYHPGEAVPLAVLEGLGSGCYLIVSDHALLPSLIEGFVGCVVPARNVKALENALLNVSDNRDLLHQAQVHNVELSRVKFAENTYISGIDMILQGCAEIEY